VYPGSSLRGGGVVRIIVVRYPVRIAGRSSAWAGNIPQPLGKKYARARFNPGEKGRRGVPWQQQAAGPSGYGAGELRPLAAAGGDPEPALSYYLIYLIKLSI
jgi:hypothetical protein